MSKRCDRTAIPDQTPLRISKFLRFAPLRAKVAQNRTLAARHGSELREPDILNIARTEGKVLVEDLARRFGVTVQTIRRDLSDLADAGKLERVHGGAVLPSAVSNIGYEDRRGLHDAAKADIARRCAEAIPDGASLFLNIGTSTEAVARALLHHTNLMVVTNNMNVANILVANTDCQIMVAGGMLRRSDGGLVGDMAARSIEHSRSTTR